MASQIAAARMKHLQTSSEALMLTSPSISAYLQTQKTSPSDESSKTKTKYQACSSCGSLLLPGYNSTVTSTKKRTRQDRLAGRSATKIISCSSCHATHILPVTTKITKTSARKETVATSSSPVANQASTATTLPASNTKSTQPTTEPSTTKKRNRNRKSTLQAMLADRKTSNVQGFGLGLGDFMK